MIYQPINLLLLSGILKFIQKSKHLEFLLNDLQKLKNWDLLSVRLIDWGIKALFVLY
jgi:hypothetical protein